MIIVYIYALYTVQEENLNNGEDDFFSFFFHFKSQGEGAGPLPPPPLDTPGALSSL